MAERGPTRVQLSRRKGSKLPPNTVVVSRPSKWGNPHRVVDVFDGGERLWTVPHRDRPNERSTRWANKANAARIAVSLFEYDLRAGKLRVTIDDVRRELRGKDLACWCPLGQACHADVLLRIANEQEAIG